LDLTDKKIKIEKVNDELYLSTAAIIEFALMQRDLDIISQLNDEEKGKLNKFFFNTYERITNKQNTLSLKPAKIYSLHQSLIAKEGVGLLHRSLFSIQK
jgi:hypothetical protein